MEIASTACWTISEHEVIEHDRDEKSCLLDILLSSLGPHIEAVLRPSNDNADGIDDSEEV